MFFPNPAACGHPASAGPALPGGVRPRSPRPQPSGGFCPRAGAGTGAERAQRPRLAGSGPQERSSRGQVLPGPVPEGHVPPHHLRARPADPLLTGRPGRKYRGRQRGEESNWGTADWDEGLRGALGQKEPWHAPSLPGSTTGSPAGSGLPGRGVGMSPGRESPRMECYGSLAKLGPAALLAQCAVLDIPSPPF